MEGHIRRKPLIALVLSFLTPGLGQLYNGQLKRAVILFTLGLLLIVIALSSALFFSFWGMVTCVAIIIGYTIFVIIDAFTNARKLHTIKAKNYNKWYLYLVIFLINSFLINPLIKNFIPSVKPYKLPTQSMSATLLIGDHIIVNKKYYTDKKPERKDIVIFPLPGDPQKDFIKRVIGLPGETIEIKEKKVYINGQPLEEPYVMNTSESRLSIAETNFGPVTVPAGKLFVLGDNRDNSDDSRHFGFVDNAALKGKALYIYWAKDLKRIGRNIN